MSHEIRNPNVEIRSKSEYQNPNGGTGIGFEFRASSLFRISLFGFRIYVSAVCLAFVAPGCGSRSNFDGPTIDAFGGKIVHEGKPVRFTAGTIVQLKVIHEKGESFNVPIKEDGTFSVGWMPIGKYSAYLIRAQEKQKGMTSQHAVPGGLTVIEGQRAYTIELGKGWKQ